MLGLMAGFPKTILDNMHHTFNAADSCQSKHNALIIGTPGGVVLGHIIDILAGERAKVREPLGKDLSMMQTR